VTERVLDTQAPAASDPNTSTTVFIINLLVRSDRQVVRSRLTALTAAGEAWAVGEIG
jgi:hypothetical protein